MSQRHKAILRAKKHAFARKLRIYRKAGPYIKTILKARGIELPFYDYIDSYAEAFNRMRVEFQATYPRLLGIHEVADEVFQSPDWAALGYGELQQIGFDNEGQELSGYGSKNSTKRPLIQGVMRAFESPGGGVSSVVLIPMKGDPTLPYDCQYVWKIAALAHEVGHVHDCVNGINFNLAQRKINLLEAEVFANLFAFEQLAKRSLVCCFTELRTALEESLKNGGYTAAIGRAVLDRLPNYELVRWWEVLGASPLRVYPETRLGIKPSFGDTLCFLEQRSALWPANLGKLTRAI